jgi:hypothetical protein
MVLVALAFKMGLDRLHAAVQAAARMAQSPPLLARMHSESSGAGSPALWPPPGGLSPVAEAEEDDVSLARPTPAAVAAGAGASAGAEPGPAAAADDDDNDAVAALFR